MISVVMPSYLGFYHKNAATNRSEKFCRAIESVIDQSYDNWELVIISDGCDRTVELAGMYNDSRLTVKKINKQPAFHGLPRNTGIEAARHDWIIYLDTDDMYLPNYLKQVTSQIGDKMWYYVNDIVFDKKWVTRRCNINKFGKCGTSNIIHRKGVLWPEKPDYGHDWSFIKRLKAKWPDYGHMEIQGYCVMHIPNLYDK